MADGHQWYEPRQHPDFRVVAHQKHLGKRECPAMNNQSNVALRKKTKSRNALLANGRFAPIVLQKSKVATVRIFGETLKREAIDDSDNLSRLTEVAYEFSAGRRGPSDIYKKNAPAVFRIFGTFGKTTFATLSARRGRSSPVGYLMPPAHSAADEP
jgi:hypothetical protein